MPRGAGELLAALVIAAAPLPTSAQNASSPPRPRVSADDSLQAERMVWESLRGFSPSGASRDLVKRMGIKNVNPLADALQITPGNEWMASLLRRRIGPSSPPVMRATRTACEASPWWCDMMYMLLLHRSGAYAQADSALVASLDKMPASVRCVWGDVAPLIENKAARRAYERMSCPERKEFEEKLWWLADPLHSTATNERRVEHYAREVAMRHRGEGMIIGTPGAWWALKVMRRATHIFHASDLLDRDTSLMLPPDSIRARPKRFDGFLDRVDDAVGYANPLGSRLSVYSFWEIMDSTLRRVNLGRPASPTPFALVPFMPSLAAVESPLRAKPTDWNLENSWQYERAFSPVGRIVAIDHQHAYFYRGQSVRFVIATDASSNFFLQNTLTGASLAMSRSPRERPYIHGQSEGPRFVFSPVLPPDSMLVSLEIVAMARGGGRTRFGSAPRPLTSNRLNVSDIALFNPLANDVATVAPLDSILPRMLSTTQINRGGTVGLFWEIYGLRAGERPDIVVNVTREPGTGIFARAFGGGASEPVFQVKFVDGAAAGEPIEGRKVALTLSTLRPGRYILELRVELPGEAPAFVTRRLQIS